MIKLPVLLVLVVGLAGCDKPPEPPPPGKPGVSDGTTPKPASSGASASTPKGPLAWDAPASFTKVENPSPMRKATYQPPKVGDDAEAPELAVTFVGGSVDANIDRWIGQFDAEAKSSLVRASKKVDPYEVIIVEMKGTFNAGGMMGGAPTPKPGFALLAAIVPVGDQSWFFKMTGPEASVKAARADFDAMVASFRPGS